MTFWLQFIAHPPQTSLLMESSLSFGWVAVSVLLAIVASYAALSASSQINHKQSLLQRLIWIVISAMTLGIGIWAMHFVGMLALSIPCGINYDPLITLLSMLPGILASAVALGITWQRSSTTASPLVGSILLGAGIGTMHYTGMAALELEGFVRYNPVLFALSILVAIVLAYIALRVKQQYSQPTRSESLLVAVILGSAVSAMHYTAMTAAYFIRGDAAVHPHSLFSPSSLSILVAVTTVLLSLGTLTLASFSRMREVSDQLRESEERFRSFANAAPTLIWVAGTDKRCDWFNQTWLEYTGRSIEQEYGNGWAEGVHPDDLDHCLEIYISHFDAHQPFQMEYRLRGHDGEYRWFIDVGRPRFDEQGQFVGYIGMLTDVSERKKLEEQIRQLAFYDTLTQLPNRRMLDDRLAQVMAASKRTACYSALLFLDLDNFKPLNDKHGHVVGDLLLIEAAKRLKSCVREMDTVARFGGDEFVVMLCELETDKVTATEQARNIAEKISAILSEPYFLNVLHEGQPSEMVEHRCTASIGFTVFVNHEGSREEILKQADVAMYQAKAAGRNSIRIYES